MSEVINIVFSNFVDIIVAIMGLVCIRYGVPAAKTAADWLKRKYLYDVVAAMVRSAEQMALAGLLEKGMTKKEQVIKWLEKKGINASDDVDRIIEEAVLDLHIIQQSVE